MCFCEFEGVCVEILIEMTENEILNSQHEKILSLILVSQLVSQFVINKNMLMVEVNGGRLSYSVRLYMYVISPTGSHLMAVYSLQVNIEAVGSALNP